MKKRAERIANLEDTLNCTIQNPVRKGASLEKYRADLDQETVMLRIYDQVQYYGNRFLRESIALRILEGVEEIRTPRVVEEWPEYSTIAIEWFDFDDTEISTDILRRNYHELAEKLQEKELNSPFDLQEDLTNHLRKTDQLHSAYCDFFDEQVEIILEYVNWGDNKKLVHGDLHLGNCGMIDDSLVIYDWEFSSTGDPAYDQAYLDIMTGIDTTVTPYHSLATAAITHWYLREEYFSPKKAIHWVNQLGKMVDSIR